MTPTDDESPLQRYLKKQREKTALDEHGVPDLVPPPASSRVEGVLPIITAGFWPRLWAFLLDALFLWIIAGLLSRMLLPFIPWSFGGPKQSVWDLYQQGGFLSLWVEPTFFGPGFGLRWILEVALKFAYFDVSYRRFNASPGKLLLGLRVRDAITRRRLNHAQIFVREVLLKPYLCTFLTLFFGYILIALRRDKRGLHDLLVSSDVSWTMPPPRTH